MRCPCASVGRAGEASHATWSAALAERCDTVCTILHSCHQELVALDGTDDICVRNWVQPLAETMGVPASDAYLGWRKGGVPDVAAIEGWSIPVSGSLSSRNCESRRCRWLPSDDGSDGKV